VLATKRRRFMVVFIVLCSRSVARFSSSRDASRRASAPWDSWLLLFVVVD
jgi:hypothetical protein